ncbi:hypothetical protein L2E82_51800 [Cichorium intybus]|nr:hypothetical protein L2E82_51800 [Cichorium intybus]
MPKLLAAENIQVESVIPTDKSVSGSCLYEDLAYLCEKLFPESESDVGLSVITITNAKISSKLGHIQVVGMMHVCYTFVGRQCPEIGGGDEFLELKDLELEDENPANVKFLWDVLGLSSEVSVRSSGRKIG